MKKIYLPLLLILLCNCSQAQNDFFIFKKGSKTLVEYFKDSYIHCLLANGQWADGNIKSIHNDSFFIQEFQVNYLPTIWHTLMPDTAMLGVRSLSIKDIYGFVHEDHSLAHVRSGKIFQVAGAAYVFLNVVNGIAYKQTIFGSSNIGRLGAGVGLFLLGKILQLTFHPVAVIGKKYHIQYMGQVNTSQ